MSWLKAIGPFFLLVIRPLLLTQQVWSWLSMGVICLTLLGFAVAELTAIVAPSPLPEPAPKWMPLIVYPLGFLALLTVLAGVTLQRKRMLDNVPRFSATVCPDNTPSNGTWLNLRVDNLSKKPIKQCRAIISSYKCVSGDNSNAELPKLGTRLMVRSQAGGGSETDIKNFAIFDVACTDPRDALHFYTPILPLDGSAMYRSREYPLGPGKYLLTINVESAADDACPTKECKVAIEFYGNHVLTATLE